MKVNEIIQQSELDEGWKGKAAALAVAAAGLAGGYHLTKDTDSASTSREVSGQVGDISKGKHTKEAPIDLHTAEGKLRYLRHEAERAGIKGHELAQFLAQVSHETLDFAHMVEQGSARYFAKMYDPKFNPRKAEILGNTQVGDGVKYKGRGYLQITGRYNYERAGKALGLPLSEKPHLLEDPKIAAKAAIWFWKQRVQPKVDDFSDTKASTRPINAGLKGLQDRKDRFATFKQEIKK